METTTPKEKGSIQRLFEIALEHKFLVFSSVLLSSLAALASFIPYISIYWAVREILEIYPDFSSSNHLLQYGLYAFLGTAANIVLYMGALMCSHLAAFSTLYELKVNFASYLTRLPLGFHVVMGSGKLRKIMDENIERIEQFIAHQLPDIVAAIVAPIAMVVLVFVIDYRYGFAILIGLAIAFAMQASLYGKEGSAQMMEQYQNKLEGMNNASVEYIRGIAVVKAFKQTVFSFKKLYQTIQEYTAIIIPYTLGWQNGFSAFNTLINHLYLFVVVAGLLIGMNTQDYQGFASTFIFYLIFIPSAAGILMKTMYVMSDGLRIVSGIQAMDNVLNTPPLAEPEISQIPTTYDIAFNAVSFAYQDDLNVLNQVSFNAPSRAITAIVGASGSGKSTIGHLIPRFFDVNEGSITIGGVDLRAMHSKDLMKLVSFVFQDVFLFKQSVMENIRLGRPGASDEEVIAAAKAAQCHEFVMALPQGYQTLINTEGVHLSGGERQRVAIARAIVKDAPIIVLDEATAFSDPQNEHLIQLAFEALLKDKTVIMIAHRLSTIKGASQILVLDKGEIIERGSHDDLIQLNQRYKKMWDIYQSSSSWTMKQGGKQHA